MVRAELAKRLIETVEVLNNKLTNASNPEMVYALIESIEDISSTLEWLFLEGDK